MTYYRRKCGSPALTGLLVAIVSISAVLPVAAQPGVPGVSRKSPGPKTLIWNYVDVDELRANAKVWHDVKGIDGFIFCFVSGGTGAVGPPRWHSGPELVAGIYKDLPQTVTALREAGVDCNFVHAGVDLPNWDWFDDDQMALTLSTFRALARIAKASGCVGVALDTEPYHQQANYRNQLWDPRGYPDHKRIDLKQRVRAVGADVARVILEEFPEAEILMIPEGAYISAWSPEGVPWFDLWMDFFNGLSSRKPPKGIVIMCSSTYTRTDVIGVASLYGLVNGLTMAMSDDPMWFRSKCSLALGANVDFVRTSAEEFARQWETMRYCSPRYAWIFGYEAKFWQLPEGTPKGKGRQPAMFEPVHPNAEKFFKVLREARESSGGTGKED